MKKPKYPFEEDTDNGIYLAPIGKKRIVRCVRVGVDRVGIIHALATAYMPRWMTAWDLTANRGKISPQNL